MLQIIYTTDFQLFNRLIPKNHGINITYFSMMSLGNCSFVVKQQSLSHYVRY